MAKTKYNQEPWEKQAGETSKSFAAFCIYRDMGTNRSLAKQAAMVYSELPKRSLTAKIRQITMWSSKHGWVDRVTAYDVYLEAKERLENEKAIKAMAKRHANEALMLQQKAIDRIKLIGEKDIEELTPKEALEYLKEAVKIERVARGAPDQIIEHDVDVGEGNVHIYIPDNGRDA